MRTTDLIRISSRQIFRQYRKNIGVMITIILGTAGLIVMITMGRSIEDNISSDLEIIGNATRLRVIFKQIPNLPPITDKREFKQETIDALRSIPGVSRVGAIVDKNGSAKLSYQDTSNRFQLIGVDTDFWKVHGASARSGRLFSSKDITEQRPVCVLGQRTAREVFGQSNPTGRFVSIEGSLFQVIGVFNRISMPDKTRYIFLPLTTARDRIKFVSPVTKLYIRCKSWDDVESVQQEIVKLIKQYQPADEIEILSASDILSRIKAISTGVKIFVQLALIATFILGGIGMWNIMMMAVRARTREIGLKKAIGAEDSDILFQFLTESLMLSSSATLIGFFLGWAGVAFTASILQNQPPDDLFWISTGIGFSFSFVLGIAAGLAPALKASRMEVVSALRYE